MKRSFARLSLLVGLALLVAVCLLTLAGPALAGIPPLWGAHEFNSRSVSSAVLPDGSAALQVVSGDPLAGGNLLLSGVGELDGAWSLSNPDTVWKGICAGVVKGRQVRATMTGTGSGDYVDYSISFIATTAAGPSPLIMKGSYWLTD
jgi:hypothetical protein